MLRMESIIEAKVNGRDYNYHCSPDSPLDDALEGLSQVQAFLIGRKQQQADQQKAQSAPKVEVEQEE